MPETTIKVTINGLEWGGAVPAEMTLLRFLRQALALTGTKEGCGVGECGACTVLLDGRAVNSCLVLAVEADGADLRTVEGEARDGQLSALQRALVENHAIQCGFCTPGMVMSAVDLVAKNPNPDEATIRSELEGNICRCTGYHNIVKAVQQAAKTAGG